MKILIATDCYIFHTGGVTNAILSLKRGLCEKGHEVRVLALSDRHPEAICGAGITIRRDEKRNPGKERNTAVMI